MKIILNPYAGDYTLFEEEIMTLHLSQEILGHSWDEIRRNPKLIDWIESHPRFVLVVANLPEDVTDYVIQAKDYDEEEVIYFTHNGKQCEIHARDLWR